MQTLFEYKYFFVQKVRNAFQHHGGKTQITMEAFAEHGYLQSEAYRNQIVSQLPERGKECCICHIMDIILTQPTF